VYLSIRNRPPVDAPVGRGAPVRVRRRAVGSTVLLLGLTSLLIDISTEMSASILPLFVFATGGSVFTMGLYDGFSQATSAVMRIVGGLTADRTKRPKIVAAVGYAATTVSRFMLVFGGRGEIVPAVVVDRTGKGLRTAPRDAMIVDAAPAGGLGVAFGVHRAMDAAGALIGPVLAFFILQSNGGDLETVFKVAAVVGVVGLAVVVLLVNPRTHEVRPDEGITFQQLAGVWRTPGLPATAVVAAALGLFTIGDVFVYLSLQRRADLAVGTFPLLFVGTSCAYLLLAAPIGRIADRTGRTGVFLVGHVLLAAVGFLLATSHGGTGVLLVSVGLIGAFYACTDGVLSALVGGLVPPSSRATGLSLVHAVQALARMGGAITFAAIWDGRIWDGGGEHTAFGLYAAGLCAVVAVTAVLAGIEGRRWRDVPGGSGEGVPVGADQGPAGGTGWSATTEESGRS
jgi:MFS family permease